jgi:hypothetical protein
MDKQLPNRHSGESRNPAPSSVILYNNQINELDPGFHRGDERGNQAVMVYSQTREPHCANSHDSFVLQTIFGLYCKYDLNKE